MRSPHFVLAFILCFFSLVSIAQIEQQDTISSSEVTSSENEIKKETPTNKAPILINGDTVFFINYSPREYSIDHRAKMISDQLDAISDKFESSSDTIYMVNQDGFITVMYDDELAFVVTENDARANNSSLSNLAEKQMNLVKDALVKNEGHNLSLTEWLIRIGYFLISVS